MNLKSTIAATAAITAALSLAAISGCSDDRRSLSPGTGSSTAAPPMGTAEAAKSGAPSSSPTRPGSANGKSSSSTDAGTGASSRSTDARSVRQGDTAGARLEVSTVREVQQQLTSKGHDAGPIDGKWGPQTQAAVRQFQDREGMKASGQLDEGTLLALGMPQATRGARSGSPSSK